MFTREMRFLLSSLILPIPVRSNESDIKINVKLENKQKKIDDALLRLVSRSFKNYVFSRGEKEIFYFFGEI